jgi:tripartite-type tricarboxylate transporter receptor subunit TctC
MQGASAAVGILTLSAALSASAVFAQEYPTRPVRILTSEAGGGNDFLARIVAPYLAAGLRQPFVVDNRASIQVGPLGAVANPDGYTLILAGSTFQFVPLMEKTEYDAIRSFVGVSQLERAPNVLVVNASLPVNSVKDLVTLARLKPGVLNYGSGSAGGSLHLGGEMFKMITGVDILRVPYKSTGPALIALLANEVQLVFSTPAGAIPHVKAGKLRALAVTSPEPTPLLPGLPTMIASGVPGLELETISFILVPAKTPVPIVRRLNQEVVRAMSQPEVKAKLMASGAEATASTPEELAVKLSAADASARKLFAAIGLTKAK